MSKSIFDTIYLPYESTVVDAALSAAQALLVAHIPGEDAQDRKDLISLTDELIVRLWNWQEELRCLDMEYRLHKVNRLLEQAFHLMPAGPADSSTAVGDHLSDAKAALWEWRKRWYLDQGLCPVCHHPLEQHQPPLEPGDNWECCVDGCAFHHCTWTPVNGDLLGEPKIAPTPAPADRQEA